jgi:hypothetical protein
MKLKRFAVIALLLYVAVTVQTASAGSIHKAAGMTLGLSIGADGDLTGSGSTAWVNRAQSLGTQAVRVDVNWASVAPSTRPKGFNASNPASAGYNWSSLDKQVRDLSSDGFGILLTVQTAPKWAEGSGIPKYAIAGTWKPNPTDLGKFAHALAERYDGHYDGLPKVTDFQAWNEPNMSQYLAPQWKNSHGGCSTSKRLWNGSGALSPNLYRGLANAFYTGVKGVSGADTVVLGGFAPYSSPNCVTSNNKPDYRMAPVLFERDVFCLNSSDHKSKGCNVKTKFDAIDSHPYPPPWSGLGPSWNDSYSLDVAVPDVYRVNRVLRAAQRAKTVDSGHIGSWVTEIAWDTKPPDKYGVSDSKAALWIEEAIYSLWNQGVNHMLWWQLGDQPNFNWTEWPGGAGLYTSAGKAKPGATAFRFPFVTHRTGKLTVEAWGRTPTSGTLKIERKSGSRWVTVSSAKVAKHEVFQASIKLSGSATFRAQVDGNTSLNWSAKS